MCPPATASSAELSAAVPTFAWISAEHAQKWNSEPLVCRKAEDVLHVSKRTADVKHNRQVIRYHTVDSICSLLLFSRRGLRRYLEVK